MIILGISYGYVATVVLMKDGKILACASEERFNNKKNYNGFPKNALDYCLKEANIQGSDVDLVTTPYLQLPPMHMSNDHVAKDSTLGLTKQFMNVFNKGRQLYRYMRYNVPQLSPIGYVCYRIAAEILGTLYTEKQKTFIANYLGISPSKVKSFDHHLCHAAAAYYASPFNTKRALVFTLDAEGDTYSGSVNIFKGKDIQVLAKIPREYSLGYIFGYITKYLGMKPHEHEYKVMGLAPYAKKEDIDKVYKIIEHVLFLDPKNPLKLKTFRNAQDFNYFIERELKFVRFDHIAGAFQKLVEEKTKEWILQAVKQTGIKTVIVSGGVFMNIKANQVISESKEIAGFYVLPSCSDETAPIGSSYLGFRQSGSFRPEPISSLYLGPEFTDLQIEKELKLCRSRIKYKKIKNISKAVARLLSKGYIVAVCNGRMEFGARALGNRSILANPANPNTIRVINEQVKNRDFWMPFAPTILHERVNEYVVNPKKQVSPYMMIGFHSTDRAKKELAASLHPYDFTLRPQMLSEKMNPHYYAIIKEFEKITGIGGVLNTSFNVHGFPIVLGPHEAIHTFNSSGLEYLALGNYLVSK